MMNGSERLQADSVWGRKTFMSFYRILQTRLRLSEVLEKVNLTMTSCRPGSGATGLGVAALIQPAALAL